MRILEVLLLTAALSAEVASAQEPSAATDVERVVLRMRPSGSAVADSAALETLAKVFEPERVPVDAGTDLEALSRQHCGRVDIEWLKKLVQANPTIRGSRIEDAMTLSAPPCPYWREDALVNILETATVSHALILQMGTQGERTRSAVAKANHTQVESLDNVSANVELKLPYASHFRSYALSDDYRGNAALALAELRGLEAHVSSVPEGELSLVAEVAGDCAAPQAADDWPFAPKPLIEVLKFNATLRPRPVRKAVIAVADTGLDAEESRLPLSFGREPRVVDQKDNDENGYVDDIWGANMDGTEGLPVRAPDYRLNEHGTHVAGLSLGSFRSEELQAMVRDRIEVRVLNLVSRQVIPASPPFERFVLRTGSVVEALRYAAEEPAVPIVNLSVETDHRDPGMSLALSNSQSLVVVAAGNSSRNLDKRESFPAALPDRGRLLAVAAHDVSGGLAGFSNWGSKTVDLAAPGCEIESILPGGRVGRQSGTSQAAPLVSFTAALLYSEGLSIPQIKHRILLTTDRDRAKLGTCGTDTGRCVASEGRLEIVRALRVYEDLVVVRSAEGKTEVLAGKVMDSCLTLNGACEAPTSKLKRLVPKFNGATARAWIQSQHKQIHALDVQIGFDAIRFTPTGSDASISIPVSTILDLVPAVFR